MQTTIDTSHLEPARADVAHQASDAVLDAARAWATAPKDQVGAIELPAGDSAARAFDAFHGARRELSRHVGGEAAANWAAGALSTAAAEHAARG